MIVALLDHLWQSTLFAVAVGLVSMSLRRNAAGVRYGLWFAASMKFLVPFALLTFLGRALAVPVKPTIGWSPLLCDLQPAAQPFSFVPPAVTSAAPTGFPVEPLLLGLWALGFGAVLVLWLVRWFALRRALRMASDANIAADIPVKYSRGNLAPGLVGIWRPVLVLPEGIRARLSPQELQAVILHELCHLRRRDNLTAGLHMIVEAVFWFHPLVWWLGARLIEEREHACDESVLRAGADPETYAHGILKVCQLYLQSPLAAVSGVSGADLNKRIEIIMENRLVAQLGLAKKILIGMAAIVTVTLPAALGLIGTQLASAGTAEASPAAAMPAATIDRIMASAGVKHAAISIDPTRFDRFAGFYQLQNGTVLQVSRDASHYFVQETAGRPVEIFPESAVNFVADGIVAPLRISFDIDPAGMVTGAVLYQGTREMPARRIGNATAKAFAMHSAPKANGY